MKLIKKTALAMLLFMGLFSVNIWAQKTKVACIGNSVTYGYSIENREVNSYPAQLQAMLGERFQVENFGHSGATLLRKGHNPYQNLPEYKAAMSFQPDVAIIHLGLNDTDPRDWPNYKDDFIADYGKMIDTLRQINPKVKIFVCKLSPIFSGHPRFLSGTRDYYAQVQTAIAAVAKAYHTEILDFNKPLYFHPNLLPDNIHPNKEGATLLASTVYQGITGDFGGLKMPLIFSNHMVLQRQMKIPFFGSANAGESITVKFNGRTLTALCGKDGQWRLEFPALEAGGPYTAEISSPTKKIKFEDILMGDVWLCSGQSNMDFPLARAATASQELANMDTSKLKNIRLMHLGQISATDDNQWDSVLLKRTNNLDFFQGTWQRVNAAEAQKFSAVAYYFGKKLQSEIQVPIGLIQISVGGSPITSWIDRNTLEHEDKLVNLLNNWRESDFLQPWVRERALKNMGKNSAPLQRHPYQPCYNFEAGLVNVIHTPIKGAFWYQGESDTHNVDLYAQNLNLLVKNWRSLWQQNFPFYVIQLSAIDRPAWQYFRNMQREMSISIPNSGLVVGSDLGDSTNVHPTQKMQIGERMANLALLKTYGKGKADAISPYMPKMIQKTDSEISILIDHAQTLQTKGGKNSIGFELFTDAGERMLPTYIRLEKNIVKIGFAKGKNIQKINYAWQPFTRANVENELGYPLSTFSLAIH